MVVSVGAVKITPAQEVNNVVIYESNDGKKWRACEFSSTGSTKYVDLLHIITSFKFHLFVKIKVCMPALMPA